MRTILAIFIFTILIIIMLLFLVLLILQMSGKKPEIVWPLTEAVTEQEQIIPPETFETEIPLTETMVTEVPELPLPSEKRPGTRKAVEDLVETDIYTFMQGPKAWKSKVDFSGSWCSEVLADQEFSVFGCGLCVLANIYSTLTPCDCSPLDMFWYAKDVSGYSPSSGYGAIDWPYMRQTLRTVGITARCMRKPSTYEKFQDYMENSICMVALVSSYYDDTYWQGVEGHYVTLWLYNREDDTVFLSDSGNPDHNRQRIPLRYIYDALKMASRFHYMRVMSVYPEKNTWNHDGITIKWKKPRYYKKMGLYQ